MNCNESNDVKFTFALCIIGAVKFGYGQSSPGVTMESGFVPDNALTIKIKKATSSTKRVELCSSRF